MTIIVCPLSEVPHELRRSRPARLISLLAPEQDAPETHPDLPRLTLRFHDIAVVADRFDRIDARLEPLGEGAHQREIAPSAAAHQPPRPGGGSDMWCRRLLLARDLFTHHTREFV